MSSLEKYLSTSSAQLLIGLFVLLILSCMGCLYILEVNFLFILFVLSSIFENNFSTVLNIVGLILCIANYIHQCF